MRALQREGQINDSDLQQCQYQLLESSIYTLFLWRNCYFTFKSGELVKEGGVPVSVDATHLIIEGTRRVDEWIEICPVVPSVFMIFRRKPRQPSVRPERDLLNVFRFVDGRQDVVSIARATGPRMRSASSSGSAPTRLMYVSSVSPSIHSSAR